MSQKCGMQQLLVLDFDHFINNCTGTVSAKKPPILVFLGNDVLWFHRIESNYDRADGAQNDEHLDRGYVKITFYFIRLPNY